MSFFKSMISALATTLVLAPAAYAKVIYSETLSSNGSKQQAFTRTVSAPKSGRYLLVLKNGESEKFARLQSLEFEINGKKVVLGKSGPGLNEKFSQASIPVDLIAGLNRVHIAFQGNASARIHYALDSEAKDLTQAKVEVSDERPLKIVSKPSSKSENGKLVADEYILERTKFRGGFFGNSRHEEVLKIPSAKSAKIRVSVPARVSSAQDCSQISFPKSVSCKWSNVQGRIENALFQPSAVEVVLNGKSLVDGRDAEKFEKIVDLDESNSLEVRVKGWVTSASYVEVQALEENIAPVAQSTLLEGIKFLPAEDGSRIFAVSAAESTDENDQVVSYRFQVRKKGASAVLVDSDWQAAPVGELPIRVAGKYDVVVSARDKFGSIGRQMMSLDVPENTAPVINSTFYRLLNNASPYQVRAEVRATDPDAGDTLEYNFAFSNGQTTGYQASNRATTTYTSSGTKSVTITVRDSAGATTTQTLSMTVGGNLVPIPSITFASARAGYAPHTINFDASNSTDPDGPTTSLRYFWDFGDGSPSVEGKQVSHTFASGEWVVSLSVLDANFGIASQSRAIFSWVNAAPVPMYSYSRVPGSLQINFDGSASTPGNSAIGNFRWELGNGTVLNQTSPYLSYTYPTAGVYSTSLRVYDQEGDANIYGQTVTVFNGQKPTANINLVASDTVLPATFILDAAGSASPNSGGSITGYKWTLPGGETRFSQSISYNRTTAGSFNVQLEVMDSFGYVSDPVIQAFSATTGVAPIAQIQVDKTTIALGQAIQVSGLTSYTPNANANLSNFEWTLPSGNKLYGPNQTINLSATGLKTISLKVTDSKGYASSLATVQVNVVTRQNPTAVITPISIGSTTIPSPVHYSGTSSTTPNPGSNITGFEWRITAPTTPPIDATFFGPEFQTTFTVSTSWTISLRVFDSAGGTSAWTSTTFGPTTNTIPVAHIAQVATDTAPATFVFNGLGSSDPDGHAIVNWHWLFSDGGEAFGPNPTRGYANPGTYTVMMRVQDEYWAWSDPVSITVNVIANQAPVALMAVSEVPGQKYQRLLDASGSFDLDGTIASYYWWIEGQAGVIGTGPQLTHTFVGGGTFVVHLDVYDNKGLQGTTQSTVTVALDHPTILKARYEVDETDTMKFAFKSSESIDADGIASYKWIEGTNTLSTSADFVHTFTTEGVHNVTLEIRDVDGVLATKAFAVRASETPFVGIALSGRDSDEDHYSDQMVPTSHELSQLPYSARLTPKFIFSGAGYSYEWKIDGIDQGITTGSLATSILESTGAIVEMIVLADDNIVARAGLIISARPDSCESDYGVCLSAPNAVSGVDLSVQDLIISNSSISSIDNIGAVIVRSIDGQEVNVTESAVISGNNILVSGAALASKLVSLRGPFKVYVSAFSSGGEASGIVPYLNFIRNSRAISSNRVSETIKLRVVDKSSGRTILNGSFNGTASYGLPPNELEVLATVQSSAGMTSSAHGFVDGEQDNANPIEIQFVAGEIGDVSQPETGAQQLTVASKASASSSWQYSFENDGLTFESKIVASVAVRELAGYHDLNYSMSKANLIVGSLSDVRSYQRKSEIIPWEASGDQSDPRNSTAQEDRNLECRAFESNWTIADSHRPAIANSEKLIGAMRSLHIGSAEVEDESYEIQQAYNALYVKYDPQTVSNNPNIFYCNSMSCMYYVGLNPGHPDFAKVPTNAKSDYAVLARRIDRNSERSRRWDLIKTTLFSQIQSFNQTYYPGGGAWPHTLMGYTLPTGRDIGVTILFDMGDSIVKREYMTFSTASLKGSYVPHARTEASIGPQIQTDPPVNPFVVEGTKSVILPFKVPKGTKALRFSVAPTERVPTRVLYGVQHVPGMTDPNYENVGVGKFSAACRLADKAYEVTQVEYDPRLANPSLSEGLFRDILESVTRPVLQVLFDEDDAATRSLKTTAYVSNSVFGKNSFIPVDFDFSTAAAGHLNGNPLWSRQSPKPTSTTALDHALRVVARHPVGEPPLQMEMRVNFDDASSDLVIVGTHLVTTSERSEYRIDVPMGQIVSRIAAASLSSGQAFGRSPTISFEAIRPNGSNRESVPKIFSPKVLFNARYVNFKDGSQRSYYSRRSSSFVSYEMSKAVSALDQVSSMLNPSMTAYNDLRINDASLPFGGSFLDWAPSEDDLDVKASVEKRSGHSGHTDGAKLDVRPFGENDLYVRLGGQTASTMFSVGSKFDDIAKLIRIGRIANSVNSSSIFGPLLREDQCYFSSGSNDHNGVHTCAGKITVEECLFQIVTPANGSTCALIHEGVVGNFNATAQFEMQTVRDIHDRLRKWITRNREALRELQSLRFSMGIPVVSILHSNGADVVSKLALIYRVNQGDGTVGVLPALAEFVGDTSAGTRTLIEDEWNMVTLLDGRLPRATTIQSQNNVTTPSVDPILSLIDSAGNALGKDEMLRTMFRFDSTRGHFDHYHFDTGK